MATTRNQFRFALEGTVKPSGALFEVLPDDHVVQVDTRLRRIDLRAGEEVWTFDPGGGAFGLGINAPFLAVSKDTAFVAGISVVVAVDLESGKERWRAPVENAGQQLSPITYAPGGTRGGKGVVVTADRLNLLVGLDATTGEPVFSSDVLSPSFGAVSAHHPGTVTVSDGGPVGESRPGVLFASGLFTSGSPAPESTLVALDPETGALIWQAPRIPRISSRPTLGDGFVTYSLFGDADGSVQRFRLDALGQTPESLGTFGPAFDVETRVDLVAQEGRVFFSTNLGGLGILAPPEPPVEVNFGGGVPMAGPVLYTNFNGARRALLAGGLPPDQHAFFVVVALPEGPSPNFLQTDIDDYNDVGQLKVNENLFAVTFIQEQDTAGPGVLIGIDLSSL